MYSPDSSEKYAIHFPSGDQAGSRSIMLVVCVKLRASPLSAGAEKISPRASKTARAPVGEIAKFEILVPTFSYRARTPGKSPATRISTFLGLFEPRSSV